MIKGELYRELEVRGEHPRYMAQPGRNPRNRNWIIKKDVRGISLKTEEEEYRNM